MAYELQAIRDQIATSLQDVADQLSDNDIDRAIEQAIRQLNHDRPYELPVDITGDGTKNLVLPSSYQKDISRIITVEYPAGEDYPIYLDEDDDWYVYEDPSKAAGSQMRLRFIESQPSASETVRVLLTTVHSVTASSSTLDQDGFSAVVYWSLYVLLFALASRYNQSNDPSIEADSVDYGARGQNYLFMAQEWEKKYRRMVGYGDKVKAAQAMKEADITFTHGEDMLWHPKRRR